MTEQQFIRKSHEEKFWKDMSVLIVDEAHERNLNTDIVLGLAKQKLCKEGSALHVVVASATIQPEQFIKHFELKSDQQVMKLEGRTFPVNLINEPPDP